MNKIKTAKDLLDLLLALEKIGNLEELPVLQFETINNQLHLCQVNEFTLLTKVQRLPDDFDIVLHTKVDNGVFIGTLPSID